MAAPHRQRLPSPALHSDVGVDIDTDINLHDSFTLTFRMAEQEKNHPADEQRNRTDRLHTGLCLHMKK